MVELRQAAIEYFKNEECEVQGACVVDWMKRELESAFDPQWWENGELDDASKELRKAFVTVLNFIADVTDNEDMRVDEEEEVEEEVVKLNKEEAILVYSVLDEYASSIVDSSSLQWAVVNARKVMKKCEAYALDEGVDEEEADVQEGDIIVQDVKVELTFSIWDRELDVTDVPGIIEEAIDRSGYALYGSPEVKGIKIRFMDC